MAKPLTAVEREAIWADRPGVSDCYYCPCCAEDVARYEATVAALEAECAQAAPVLAAATNLDDLLTAATRHDGPRFPIDVQYGTIAAFQVTVAAWRAAREG